MMQFASFQEFLLMDGHGPYVWLAVFVSIAVLVALVISPLRQQRKAMDRIARQLLIDQSNKENK
jgi:heme exporter protein D